jgi:hypothetical protein
VRGRVGQRALCKFDRRQQRGGIGGLVEPGVSAGVLAGRSPARLVGAAVDEHERVVCGLGIPRRAQQLQAVDLWHPEVGDQEVGANVGCPPRAGGPGAARHGSAISASDCAHGRSYSDRHARRASPLLRGRANRRQLCPGVVGETHARVARRSVAARAAVLRRRPVRHEPPARRSRVVRSERPPRQLADDSIVARAIVWLGCPTQSGSRRGAISLGCGAALARDGIAKCRLRRGRHGCAARRRRRGAGRRRARWVFVWLALACDVAGLTMRRHAAASHGAPLPATPSPRPARRTPRFR